MRGTALRLLAQGLITLGVVAASLAAYDRIVLRPALIVGVVDVAAVYRAKEEQFTQALTQAHSETERQQALQLARVFARRLPAALDELPHECNCLVLVKTTVAGATPNTLDLTARLRRKVDAP